MKPYRQWFSDRKVRSESLDRRQLRRPKKIEDYYLTPWDMGNGSFIDDEHDFIGRDALQKLARVAARR